MNVPVYLEPLYLRNQYNNFFQILHVGCLCTNGQSWKVLKNSIHKQKFFVSEWNFLKLSRIHYQYMGKLHAKFKKNWWSGFRDIALHDTQGHSFIIIRMCILVYFSTIPKFEKAKFLSFHLSPYRSTVFLLWLFMSAS